MTMIMFIHPQFYIITVSCSYMNFMGQELQTLLGGLPRGTLAVFRQCSVYNNYSINQQLHGYTIMYYSISEKNIYASIYFRNLLIP